VLQVLPQALVAPAAGVINDRISRKKVMVAADLARAGIVILMLFAARGGWLWAIYCLLFLETLMWGFFEPGRSASVPNITSGEELVVANALGSVTWSVNLALGAGLGGLLAAFLGRDAVFVLNSASFLLSAALLRGMNFREGHVAERPLRARELADYRPIAEGVRYIRRNRCLAPLLLAKAGLGVMGTHWVLLPIYGERIFPVTAGAIDARRGAMLGMSLLLSSRGIGALLGPLVAGYWTGQDRRRVRYGVLAGFSLAAMGYFALAGAPSLGAAALTVVLAHSGVSMVWVFATTLIQWYTDDRFRGRVFAVDFAFLVTGMSAASFVTGTLVDAGIGVRTLAAATGAVACIPALAWVLVLRRWPKDQSP
jgi:MFS family permease